LSDFESGDFPYAYSYTARISFSPGARTLWDMEVHYSGTLLNAASPHQPILLDRKIRFEYVNGKYSTHEILPVQ
jgi:hypothetical protein